MKTSNIYFLKIILPFFLSLDIQGYSNEPREVFSFSGAFDVNTVVAKEARVAVIAVSNGKALEFHIAKYDTWAWPGVMIPIPASGRDASQFGNFLIDVENTGKSDALLGIQIESTGGEAAKRRMVRKFPLAPGERKKIRIIPQRLPPREFPAISLFHMTALPPWATISNGDCIDMADLQKITFYVTRPSTPLSFAIHGFYLEGQAPPMPPNPLPFVDTFGQYKHDDWDGKIHSVTELAERTRAELALLEKEPAPETFNAWGGWSNGPRLKATGFFRVEKFKNKWTLVDPSGQLFIIHGMHGVRFGTATPIENRQTWFENFPGNLPEFSEFLSRGTTMVSTIYPVGQNIDLFNFNGANLKRKYGVEWKEMASEVALKRLHHWGMNTLGANGDASFYFKRKIPYYFFVDASSKSKPIVGSGGYWGKFPDPFDPAFAKGLVSRFASDSRVKEAAQDPWCIGLGIDNELSWGAGNDLAVATLKSPTSQAAKQVFVSDLQKKYQSIQELNQQWGTAHGSWEALAGALAPPDAKRAKMDLDAFTVRLAESYFATCRDAVKAVAPNHLYTGCRFMVAMPLAESAAAKYADLVSFNHYERGMKAMTVGGGLDKPFLIGEFHFTAPGSGYFSPSGIVEVADQKERAEAYTRYWNDILNHPLCLGAHWFMYGSQPMSGAQANGETYPCGFVDLVDTPYPDLVAAARDIGNRMYLTRFSRGF